MLSGNPVTDEGVCETPEKTENLLIFLDTTLGVQEETFSALFKFLYGSRRDYAIGHLGRSGDVRVSDDSVGRHGGGLWGEGY